MGEESQKDTSESNSRKLDRILIIFEGEPDAPGVLGRMAAYEETLFGQRGANGIVGKVNIMWRAHVWILCSLSAFGGYLLKELFPKIVK